MSTLAILIIFAAFVASALYASRGLLNRWEILIAVSPFLVLVVLWLFGAI